MPHPPIFNDKYAERTYLKERLALAFRIFATHGFMESVAGHITVRDPVDPSTFWVNPFGLHFALITADDLIRVSHDGNVIEGGRVRLLNTAAFAIHSGIHAARPDVMCAAHAHSIHGRAFCVGDRNLDMLTQDACIFYNDIVVYDTFEGVVLDQSEGKNIAACLGNKKAALLANHGLLTCGDTIEATVFWFVSLDKTCHTQLLAEAAVAGTGKPIRKIGDAEAQATYKTVGSSQAGYFDGLPLFQMAERELGQSTYLGQGQIPW